MNTLKADFPIATQYLSGEMAAWLERGQTLGRLWNACRGRIES